MKIINCSIRKIALLVALCVMTMVSASAQEQSAANVRFGELAKRYKGVKGVICVTVTKGAGLGLFKAMLNQQFGKDFMKGVTGVTLIEYSGASEDVYAALRKELDTFSTLLKEFDISKEKQFANSGYAKCFAAASDSGTLSDFIVALESDKSKVMMYMSGEIKVE